MHPDFDALSERARELLQAPSNIDWIEGPDGFRTVLRISHYPSFEPMVVWDIAVQTEGSAAWVYEMTWDRPSDLRRFNNPLIGLAHPLKFRPIPSLYLRQAAFDANMILSQLERIDFRSLDASLQSSLCIDGVQNFVEVRPDQEVLTFEWMASCGPPECSALISWTHDVTQLLLSMLSDCAARPI